MYPLPQQQIAAATVGRPTVSLAGAKLGVLAAVDHHPRACW
jgi:hypothetical protein